MSELLQVATVVVGTLTFVCSAIAVVTAYANKGRIDRLSQENHELREAIRFAREESDRQKTQADAQVAELRAQVDFLSGAVVDRLVESFRAAVVDAIHEVLEKVDRRGS